MHPPRFLWVFPLIALLFAGALASCGDGGDEPKQASGDLADVPTATLPAELPKVTILGDVQQPADGTSYTIQSGDTLATIADRFGTTVDAILAANNVDPTQLVVGQVLVIPGPGTEQEVLPATVQPTPENTERPTTYTVQSGDNASNIADSFGITVDELAAANGTTVDDLRSLSVGDVLTIPPAP